MKARCNILTLIAGLAILSIAATVNANVSRASIVQHSHAATMGAMPCHGVPKMLSQSTAKQISAHKNAPQHKQHDHAPDCFEHCAGMPVVNFAPIAGRYAAVEAVKFKHHISIAELTSSIGMTASHAASRAGRFSSVRVHRTGVSGLLQTNMRLRN